MNLIYGILILIINIKNKNTTTMNIWILILGLLAIFIIVIYISFYIRFKSITNFQKQRQKSLIKFKNKKISNPTKYGLYLVLYEVQLDSGNIYDEIMANSLEEANNKIHHKFGNKKCLPVKIIKNKGYE